VLREVDTQLARLERRRETRAARRPGATKDRVDAGEQLLRAERLGDVVVRASREAADLLLRLRACSEHDDRHPRERADATADLISIHIRELQVENDEIRLFGLHRVQRT